jgi:hypothetical protein
MTDAKTTMPKTAADNGGIVPRCLAYAAAAYARKPAKLGEIVLALVGGECAPKCLDEGQTVVLTICREELAAAAARRESARLRRARSRAAAKREGGAR